MMRLVLVLAVVLGVGVLVPAPGVAQTDVGVSGAGAAVFPGGATLYGIPLSGLELGQGVFIAGDGSATGEFYAVLLGTSLLGQPQNIAVDGKVTDGSAGPDSGTFSGVATVDMGDGTAPLPGVPFTVTVTGQGMGTLLLTVGDSGLPDATVAEGGVTIQ